MLFIHGALGAARQFQPLLDQLQQSHWPQPVHTLDLPGHGGSEIPATGFSIPAFSQFVLDFMDQQGIEHTDIFGYSMGGYVALHLASQHPQRVGRIATLATKFAWSAETAQKEVALLDPAAITAKVPQFATALQQRHAPQDWQQVLHHTAQLMLGLGNQPVITPELLAAIEHPVLLMLGDRDRMVSLDETIGVYRQLKNASLAVLPGMPHPIEQARLPQLAFQLTQFFRG